MAWVALIAVAAILACLAWRYPGYAVVAMPGTVAVLFLAFHMADHPLAMLASLLLVPLVLGVVYLSRGVPGREAWPHVAAKWGLIILGPLPAVAVAIDLGLFFGIAFTVVFAAFVIQAILMSRRSLVVDTITTISASMRQNLPLPQALEAAGGRGTDRRAEVLRSVADLLGQGVPLSSALALAYRGTPGEAIALIAAAEPIQQVPSAVARLEAEQRRQGPRNTRLSPLTALYPVMLVLAVYLLASRVAVFVMANFEAMMQESGRELPAASAWLCEASRRLRGPPWLVTLGIALAGSTVFIYTRFRPRRPHNPHPLSVAGDVVKWRLPIFHRLEKSRSLGRLVEYLRLCLEAGTTLDEAISNSLLLDLNGTLRRRVERWRDKVLDGRDVAEAAREARLGRRLAWAFDRQVNPVGAPAALEVLEGYYRSQHQSARNVVRSVVWPCMVIAVGACVGLVAYAILAPYCAILAEAVETALP